MNGRAVHVKEALKLLFRFWELLSRRRGEVVVYTSMPKQPLICNRKGIQAVDFNKPASNRFYLLKLPPPHRIRTQASNDTEAGILSGVSQK